MFCVQLFTTLTENINENEIRRPYREEINGKRWCEPFPPKETDPRKSSEKLERDKTTEGASWASRIKEKPAIPLPVAAMDRK